MVKKTTQKQEQLQIPKFIVLSATFIAFFSTKLATRFAAKLFTTPIKHKVPKREIEMDKRTIQNLLYIPKINKKIMLYVEHQNHTKILLVHGWSGRGTQLFKIADALIAKGFSTYSFDAPGHGKSPGNNSIMIDFIESILEIDHKFGPFDIVIGHSLGGMATLNAIKNGLKVNQAIIIGSGDVVQDIINDFVQKLKLKPIISVKLRDYFEKKYNEKMDDFSAHLAATKVNIPVLIIHDKNDYEVGVSAATNIHKHLKNGELVLTEGLGHRKILGNHAVIGKIISFILTKQTT